MYGMGVAVGDYDNDGRDDVYITGLGGDVCSTTKARPFKTSRRRPASTNARFRGQRRLGGLRPRRQARPLRHQLRAVDGEGRSIVLARWLRQVLLHAGIVQGHIVEAFRNLGNGRFEDVTEEGRASASPPANRWASRCIDYNGDGWPDLVRRQRHAAQQALPQSAATGPSKRKACRRALPSAKTA